MWDGATSSQFTHVSQEDHKYPALGIVGMPVKMQHHSMMFEHESLSCKLIPKHEKTHTITLCTYPAAITWKCIWCALIWYAANIFSYSWRYSTSRVSWVLRPFSCSDRSETSNVHAGGIRKLSPITLVFPHYHNTTTKLQTQQPQTQQPQTQQPQPQLH